jgi:hypothetical protein
VGDVKQPSSAIRTLGDKLIAALPAPFIALLIINGGFLWFEVHAQAQRAALMDRVLDACMSRVEVK